MEWASDKDDETPSVTYTLQDAKLEFHYLITSYAAENVFDAANTGFFTKLSYNNFEEIYQDNLLNQLNLENICDLTVTPNRAGRFMLFSVS